MAMSMGRRWTATYISNGAARYRTRDAALICLCLNIQSRLAISTTSSLSVVREDLARCYGLSVALARRPLSAVHQAV
jgi:hypothetical protein